MTSSPSAILGASPKPKAKAANNRLRNPQTIAMLIRLENGGWWIENYIGSDETGKRMTEHRLPGTLKALFDHIAASFPPRDADEEAAQPNGVRVSGGYVLDRPAESLAR